ncbi:MAG: SDR family NAD(P)-dependent oxidoreductase [Actinomycetia bacterium]|nr:SDR family NAD(P)-dependent oxidoreductase [Actinomycetes bacterium]
MIRLARGAWSVQQNDHPLTGLIDLTGKAGVVTGAAQGFGFACADRLSEAGAGIVLADTREERLHEAAERLQAHGGRQVELAVADVTDPNAVELMIQTAVDRLGRLDILVNNAGIFSNCLIENLDHAEFQRIMAVNLSGTYLATRAAVVRMREQGRGGAIINISSIDAVHPTAKGLSHYDASKAAVWGFTKSMALELGPEGIRVNAIAPGPSRTEGVEEVVAEGAPAGIDVEAQWAELAQHVPLGRLADPDEIGRTAVYLASELASYVHGTQIIVDGGYLVA